MKEILPALNIINSLNDAAAILKGLQVISINHLFTTMLGLKKSELPISMEEFFGKDYKKIEGPLQRVLHGEEHSCQVLTSLAQKGISPGTFFCLFYFSRLDNTDDLILVTIRDANCKATLKYLPLVVLTALLHHDSPRITYISPLIRRWTGIPEGEFYQDFKTLYRHIHPEDYEYAIIQLNGFFHQGKDLDVTFRLTSEKGNYIWTHWQGTLYVTPQGDEFLFAAVEDVTSRKEAEIAIIDSNVRYRTIFENAPLGIGYCDRTGTIVECNNYLARLLNVKQNQLIGYNALSSKNPILRGMVKRTLRGEQPRFTGLYISDISNERVYISATGVPVKDDTGRTIAAIAFIEDMEERRSLELSLKKERDFSQAVLESAHILLAVTDSSGNILRINHVMAELLGWRESELLGANIWDTIVKKGEEASMQKAFSIATTFDRAGPIEIECISKTGDVFHISWTFRSLLDRENAVDAIVCTGIDITERKRLESQLRMAQKMEAIGRLAGGVAHEFNNLLMAILGQCELLLMALDKEDPLRKRVEAIQCSSARASDITKKLLTFSKKGPLTLTSMDLNRVIEKTVALLERTSPNTIGFKLKLSKDPLKIMGDEGLISQAIINIVQNSIDAMGKKGMITISSGSRHFFEEEATRFQMDPGEYCFFAVEDKGVGMDKEVLERAFEPFFTTKAFGEGKGLGLSLVHGIALKLGGKVYIESSTGKGTRVFFFLPKGKGDATLLAEQPRGGLPRERNGQEFFDLSILIVEDEDMVRETLSSHLEALGARIYTAKTAEQGLNLLKEIEEEPGIIITDLALPGMDGKTLLRKAQGICPGVMGIIMSSYPLSLDSEQQLDTEFTSFLKKPFSIKDLTITIKELMRRRLFSNAK